MTLRPTAMPPKSNTPEAKDSVLVADDDEAIRRAMTRVLGAAGFEVVTVPDGNAAVEALMKGSFSVILSDIQMPGTSGVDLLRLVRAYDLDVPVLLITGAPEVNSAMEAVELGAVRYLTKPIEPEEIVKAVRQACHLHRLAHAKREALSIFGRAEGEAGDRAGLMATFERALASLWVAFQPVIAARDRRVVAYEALLRSDEPSLPTPTAVVKAAEDLGRANDLGTRVRALTASEFAKAAPGVLLFVNLHPLDLLDPDMASAAAPLTALAERTVLEITERAPLGSVKDVELRLEILRYMGFRIAVDDLGAGAAGLSSFARLSPEFVKLDMALVRNVHLSEVSQRVVRAMTSLCKDMNVRVIAEGVETAEERDALAGLGCDWMQGYLFARPQRGFALSGWC